MDCTLRVVNKAQEYNYIYRILFPSSKIIKYIINYNSALLANFYVINMLFVLTKSFHISSKNSLNKSKGKFFQLLWNCLIGI